MSNPIEAEIIEAIEAGRKVSVDVDSIVKDHREVANEMVENIKDGDFARKVVICGITGKECDMNSQCSICPVALQAITNVVKEQEEEYLDLAGFKEQKDKKSGIVIYATPSKKIMRFQNMAQMLAHFGFQDTEVQEITDDSVIESFSKALKAPLKTIVERLYADSASKYISKEHLVFEREGGAVIAVRTM